MLLKAHLQQKNAKLLGGGEPTALASHSGKYIHRLQYEQMQALRLKKESTVPNISRKFRRTVSQVS